MSKKANTDKAFKEIQRNQQIIAKEIESLMNRFIAYGGYVEMITKYNDEEHGEISRCDKAFEVYSSDGNLHIYSEDF